MERHERWEDAQEAHRAALDGHQAELWTALPGIVQSFDAADNTVTVQPAIMGKLRKPDGTYSDITMPQLIHVPVHFQSGGGYTLTVPPKKGDECLVVFSSRCIDGWWRDGGVQKQLEVRMHDLSDGFAILGTRSKKNALKNVSTSSAQWRTEDGKSYVELKDSDVNIVSSADMNVTVKGKVTIKVTGDCSISVDGNTTVNGKGAVNVNGNNIVLNGGGQMVARVGDATICPAGQGRIVTGAPKVVA